MTTKVRRHKTAPAARDAEDGQIRELTPEEGWELFDEQPRGYREAVLPPSVRPRLAVEAALPLGWHRYVGDGGDIIGVERFGASAPGNVVIEKFGFTVDHVVERARALL